MPARNTNPFAKYQHCRDVLLEIEFPPGFDPWLAFTALAKCDLYPERYRIGNDESYTIIYVTTRGWLLEEKIRLLRQLSDADARVYEDLEY